MDRSSPQRFVTRTLVATLASIAFALTAVFVVVTLGVRDHARRSVIEKLETGGRLLATLEQRHTDDLRTQVAALAENSPARTALETYAAERQTASEIERSRLIATIGREMDRLAARLHAHVLIARDLEGEVLTVSGRHAQEWTAQAGHPAPQTSGDTLMTLPTGVFRAVTVPIMLQDDELGSVQVARALDNRYATELSELSGARAVIVSDDQILATTLRPEAVAALTPEMLRTFATGAVTIGAEEYAVRPLLHEGSAAVYMLDSIDAAARPLVRSSQLALVAVAIGAFGLAAIASVWLARTISRPIDTLSQSLREMTRTRTFDRRLTASGASLEVDALADAFNRMMGSLQTAEGETLRACLETIREVAISLDARDPFRAGHSERVSALSVAIGRRMRLDDATVEILRVGALLHDIGKIGITDNLLRKPAPLTADEYETIKTHAKAGSRILRAVRFLDAHLPVVELHHERPDGGGYPHGLKGDQIPMAARIVHAADAYDAMTSTRAYRPAFSSSSAIAELQRGAGTLFDVAVVRALVEVMAQRNVLAIDGAGDEFRSESDMRAAESVREEAPHNPLDDFDSEGHGA